MNAYALTDRATWLNFGNRGDLKILVEGDKRLFNQYGIILVNPEKHPHVKVEEGQAFIDWLISEEGFFPTPVAARPSAFGGERTVAGIARDVGFVHLDAGTVQIARLRRQRVRDRQRQRGEVVIVLVEQRARQHVGAGQREFERAAGERRGARAIIRQVQRSFPDRPHHHARGLAAETHFRFGAERRRIRAAGLGPDAAEPVHEVVDHPVGFGMVDIEAVQLAVAYHVDTGLFLRVDDDPRRVHQRLLGRQAVVAIERGRG